MKIKSKLTKITAPIGGVCKLFGALAACCTLAPYQAVLGANSTLYSHGEPTNLEQYQLELVNAARAKPSEEASRLGIGLNTGLIDVQITPAPKQPLAFHPLLLQVARGHSDWMLATGNFSHTGLDGSNPSQRAEAKGYNFSVGENINYLSTSGTPDLNFFTINTYENLFKSPGHRPNLMDPSFSVVGLGLREGKFKEKDGDDLNALMVTQNFSSGGNSTESGPFLVGVVYDDLNQNGAYDPGEGISGVRVEPNFGGYYAITTTSGGYAVPLPPLETVAEDYDIQIPIVNNKTTFEDIRPYDEKFRKLKIENATEVTVQITWSGDKIGQTKQSSVKIRRPVKINYQLIGSNKGEIDSANYQSTMVSSLNVKADLKVSLPRITSQPPATQIVNVGSAATISVSATGTDLTYQWYQGASGDTSNPVGSNSSSLTIPSLTTNTNYWVRVVNENGSVDSTGSLVVVLHHGTKIYSHGDPTGIEQYQLELVNAARAKPSDEASRLGIDLNKELTPGRISSAPKQPLAFHHKLLKTAQGHSDWMLEKDIFDHEGLNDSTPSQRAAANGYSFSVAENIAYTSTSGTPNYNNFTVTTYENLFKSHTHRPNLMDPNFSVVGIGLREGKFKEKTGSDLNALMVTQNFSSGGDSIDSGPFLVGVVYDDLNQNGAYDPGEGIPGVRVEPDFGEYYSITSKSGGYAVPITPLEAIAEDYDIPIPIVINKTPYEDIRPYDEAFRKLKVENASEMTVQITWSGDNIGQAKQSSVKIRRPVKINYQLIGSNKGDIDSTNYEGTMVSSLNVKADLKFILPSITSQPPATQFLNTGSASTLSVSATGTDLTYQWYKGASGDTSNPVGSNSSSFTISSITSSTSYWVRVTNARGSVDSAESVVVVLPLGIRVGDQFAADLSPLVTGGKTLKLVGKLPAGLSLNTKTWQITGTIGGNAGNFTTSIQVIQNKAVSQTISIPISVGNFPTSLLGNYEALLKDQNGAPFGVFKLTTGKNVWTASLETLGQARRTAKGGFILKQGAASASFEAKFTATKTAPAIALNFTLDGDSPIFVGTYGAGSLEGFKMINSLASATQPILYNLIIDQGVTTALDKPAGKGWASGSFAKTGRGVFKGMLGDATACSFSLGLSLTGQAILWAQPYANKNSFIGGVVNLVDLVPNANQYEVLEPRVSWVKVADTKTLSYPNGFSFDNLSVSGSGWLVPATHTALGNSLGWLGGEKCKVKIYGAGLSTESQQGTSQLPTEFTLDKDFKLTAPINASTIKWSGSVMKGTGAFSGSFIFPAGLSANTIAGPGTVSGLLLQDGKWGINTGAGFVKVPINGAKGSYNTAAIVLEQPE